MEIVFIFKTNTITISTDVETRITLDQVKYNNNNQIHNLIQEHKYYNNIMRRYLKFHGS